jgi:hypothetical protein
MYRKEEKSFRRKLEINTFVGLPRRNPQADLEAEGEIYSKSERS